jgi:hypothetical protein
MALPTCPRLLRSYYGIANLPEVIEKLRLKTGNYNFNRRSGGKQAIFGEKTDFVTTGKSLKCNIRY